MNSRHLIISQLPARRYNLTSARAEMRKLTEEGIDATRVSGWAGLRVEGSEKTGLSALGCRLWVVLGYCHFERHHGG